MTPFFGLYVDVGCIIRGYPLYEWVYTTAMIDKNCNNVIFDSINQHLDYFKNETLCIDINRTDVIDFECNTTFKLNSENIELGIKKL